MTPKKFLFSFFSIISIIGYGVFVFAAPPSIGGYSPGEILDPECAPNAPDCIVALPGGGSGWGLTGNSSTDADTNFIGTTDAQDFVIKTNGNEIARFGQNYNLSLLNYNDGVLVGPDANGNSRVTASGAGAMAWGGSAGNYDYPLASGVLSTAWGLGTKSTSWFTTAWGDRTSATEENATAFGTNTWASGTDSTAWGEGTIASGNTSTAFGQAATASGRASTAFGNETIARSVFETAFGASNTDYTPLDTSYYFNLFDRLLSIGNGEGFGAGTSWPDRHNAYTLWKDGSFAYNDDNFQNDNTGTEQNMFYFNYGNHDGLGSVQTKRAIRLGSAVNDEWDINSANVGDRSVAIGFGSAIASGDYSISFGIESEATGTGSIAWGEKSEASGIGSTAWGDSRATEMLATAFGNQSEASGEISTAIGSSSHAYSYAEFALGSYNTSYIPNSISLWDSSDRLFIIGNGDSVGSDAFTILKNGKTGIGYDNFETTALTALLQVNGSINQTGAIGCALESDANGEIICAPSDQNLKQNISDITYGLDTVTALRPVSYTFKNQSRFGSDTKIGFLAQDLQQVVPELVSTTGDYLSVNYGAMTPVLVKAIQEMNLNITNLSDMTRSNTWRDSLIAWFGNVENGITDLFAKRAHVEQLCIGTINNETCLTKDQVDTILNSVGTVFYQAPVVVPTSDPAPTTPDQEIDNSIINEDQSDTSNEIVPDSPIESPTEITTNETTE